MIYTGLNRTGEVETVKANGGADIAEVYGGINESNPIYYKTRTITGQAPLSYKALSKPLSDYLISGNTLQDGTPTPSDPVDVVGCGARTAQLIPEIVQGGVSTIDGSLSNSSNRVRTNYISVESGKTYAVSSGNLYLATGCYYNNGVFSSKIGEVVTVTTSATFTVPENVNQIVIGFRTYDGTINIRPSDLQSYMLNEDSTSLPYEPYGYKLPPTVNGTEYPIYLGQVESTRWIKKLVFDGTEKFNIEEYLRFTINVHDIKPYAEVRIGRSYCSHYECLYHEELYDNEWDNVYYQNGNMLFFHDRRFAATADFKSYLAAQYAAGTPVTVWYVLAEPETGIVNEPLHKIGDYADTITMAQAGVTIPTVAGTNTLTVDTTVQPSEVSITGNIKEVQGT